MNMLLYLSNHILVRPKMIFQNGVFCVNRDEGVYEQGQNEHFLINSHRLRNKY